MTVIHNSDNHEFRIELVPGEWARITYRLEDGVMVVDHSSVPESQRGQGKGSVMMEAFLPEAEKLGYKITPECSYVKHYMTKHENWHHLLAE